MIKISVIGTGFAGLSTAWHLLQLNPSIQVTLIDSHDLGSNASGIASGLLHLYTGRRVKLDWESEHALKESLALIQHISAHCNQALFSPSGVLRIAYHEEQVQDFLQLASKTDDVDFLTPKELKQKYAPIASPFSGLFIKKGGLVDVPTYLKGLFTAIQSMGALFIKKQIYNLQELQDYDSVVLALGSRSLEFATLDPIRLNPVKGHILKYRWPKNLLPPSIPIASSIHIRMCPDNQHCLVGATYERDDLSSTVDIEKARSKMEAPLFSLIPALKDAGISKGFCGIRVSPPNRLPMLGQLNDKTWIFTGLGSKALLYHAWLGRLLASAILTNNKTLLPQACQRYLNPLSCHP